MASSPPVTIRPTDCCTTTCTDSSTSSGIPGPQGPPGNNGTNGNNGANAYTTTSAQFTQPAGNNNVTVTVADSTWTSVGQILFVSTGGYYAVNSKPDSTHLVLTNLAYPNNAAPATVIATSQTVSASGLRGQAGQNGAAGGFIQQGVGAPVAAPPNVNSTSIYVDTNTGVFYYWNILLQAWV